MAADASFMHCMKKSRHTADIVVEVERRILHRLADRLEAGQVHDHVHTTQRVDHARHVGDIGAHQLAATPSQGLYVLDGLPVTATEVVDHDHVVPGFQELGDEVGSDVACAACDHDPHG